MIRGAKHPLAKLTERKIIAMRTERATKRTSYAKLGKKYGNVAAQTAHGICRGTRWPHVGGPIEKGRSRRRRTRKKAAVQAAA